jgi:hypothetical protein
VVPRGAHTHIGGKGNCTICFRYVAHAARVIKMNHWPGDVFSPPPFWNDARRVMGKAMTAPPRYLLFQAKPLIYLLCTRRQHAHNTLSPPLKLPSLSWRNSSRPIVACKNRGTRKNLSRVTPATLCGLLAFHDRHFLHGPPPPSAHTEAYKPITQADAARGKKKNLSLRKRDSASSFSSHI